MKKCEKCDKEIDGTYGSGRFCSLKCANTRIFTDDTKKKLSSINKKRIKRNKIQCSKCGKLISKSNYNKHFDKCGDKEKIIRINNDWLQDNGLYKCPNCGKEFSKNGICSHIIFSHIDNKKSNFVDYLDKIRKGEIKAWNKGLTKETDDRIKNNSISVKNTVDNKIKGGWIPGFVTYIKTEKGRIEQSNRKKKLYTEFPEKHPNRKLANNRNTMTYPEKVAYDWLVNNNVEFEHQKKIDKYYVDFLVRNIVIEIDGERWHDDEKDKERDKIIEDLGYKIFRIKSKENITDKLVAVLFHL